MMDTNVTMNGENEARDKKQSATPTPKDIGESLKNAREALSLSQQDAANRLHLNPKIIAMLEDGDFDNGPPLTFLRGYLRSYSRLLLIPEAEIKYMLDQTVPQEAPVAAPPVAPREPLNSSHLYVRYMTYFMVCLLVGLVTLWWKSHIHSQPENATIVLKDTNAIPKGDAPATPLNNPPIPVEQPAPPLNAIPVNQIAPPPAPAVAETPVSAQPDPTSLSTPESTVVTPPKKHHLSGTHVTDAQANTDNDFSGEDIYTN